VRTGFTPAHPPTSYGVERATLALSQHLGIFNLETPNRTTDPRWITADSISDVSAGRLGSEDDEIQLLVLLETTANENVELGVAERRAITTQSSACIKQERKMEWVWLPWRE